MQMIPATGSRAATRIAASAPRLAPAMKMRETRGTHELVGGQQIAAGEFGARGSLRFRESAEVKSQRLVAVRREHLREVGPVGLIGGIHVREDHAGRSGAIKMTAQQHAVGGRERDVLAAEICRLARRIRREASRGQREYRRNRKYAARFCELERNLMAGSRMRTSEEATMTKLHGTSRSRSARSLWALEELGVTYEHLPMPTTEAKSPAHLKLNPNGHVPVLEDDGVVVWESMAINLYLAEKYGKNSLWPSDPAARADVYKWSFFAMTEVEPHLITHFAQPRDESARES